MGIILFILPQNHIPLFLFSLEVLLVFKLAFIICNDINLLCIEYE